MPKRDVRGSFRSYDDLFGTDETRAEENQEKILQIPVSELHPFKDHPFKVRDDEEMEKMADSIREYGVLVPLLARSAPEGGYEIVSGHRRHHAAELAGIKEIPVIVREMDDDTAIIAMVDANLQRENILPSERAASYKMKMEALKHQGQRRDLQEQGTSCQVGTKLRADEQLAMGTNESARTVQRYIRLNNLLPDLLEKVDQKEISFNPAVELSYLKPEEQQNFIDVMEELDTPPSLSQAQRLKKLSQENRCSKEAMEIILEEDKKAPLNRVVLDDEVIRKYFPKTYTTKQMEDTIIKLLDQWQKKRERGQER